MGADEGLDGDVACAEGGGYEAAEFACCTCYGYIGLCHFCFCVQVEGCIMAVMMRTIGVAV